MFDPELVPHSSLIQPREAKVLDLVQRFFIVEQLQVGLMAHRHNQSWANCHENHSTFKGIHDSKGFPLDGGIAELSIGSKMESGKTDPQ